MYIYRLSAGSFLISTLVYVFNVKRFEPIGRLAVFTAGHNVAPGSVRDLGRPRPYVSCVACHRLCRNFRSPMAWMIWLYGAYFVLLLVGMWFLFRRDLVDAADLPGPRGKLYRLLALGSKNRSEASAVRDRKVIRLLATVGIPIAILFHGGVGSLFGVVAARPYWHSGMFPILFLVSALVSGGALLAVIAAIFQDGWRSNAETVLALGRVVLGLLVLDVLFQASEFLVAFYGGIPDHIESLQLVIRGPFWWVFWGWQLLLGTFIPLLLLMLPTRRDPRWVSLAGLLTAVGFLGVRLNIVIPDLRSRRFGVWRKPSRHRV